MQKHLANASALMRWMNYQSGNADLIGFFVSPDGKKPDENVLAISTKAELMACLDFFYCFIVVGEALGVHQNCFLRVRERKDCVHFARDLWIAMVDGSDANHVLVRPNVGANRTPTAGWLGPG